MLLRRVCLVLAATMLGSACQTTSDTSAPEPPTQSVPPSAGAAPTTTVPAVLQALHCGGAGPSRFASGWGCERNGAIALLFPHNYGSHVPKVDEFDETIDAMVDATVRSRHYNKASDVFVAVPEGILYLPGEFFTEAFDLVTPGNAYHAEAVDTDLYGN